MSAADVFISYSREDQAVARRFADALAAEGFSVWWDTELRPGESFDAVIEHALRAARAVVVLWSPRSVASRWVRAEATLADKLKTLVPVIVEPCDLPIMFELTHAAQLNHWQGAEDDRAWTAFLASLRRFTGAEAVTATTKPAATPAPPRATGGKPSLAIQPFTDLSANKDQGPFIDGLMEELAVGLSRVPLITLVSPGATPRYSLGGSVRSAADKLRVTVTLSASGAAGGLWTERFDGAVDDPFMLQEQVAANVVAKLEGNITKAEVSRLEAQPTGTLNADELVLLAQQYSFVWQRDPLLRALGLLDRALDLTPGHPLASATAAWCHSTLYLTGWTDDPVETKRLGMALGLQALQAAQLDPLVLFIYASAELNWGNDLASVDAMLDRALVRTPDSPRLRATHAWVRTVSGKRAAVGLDMIDAALALDPESDVAVFSILAQAISLHALGRFDEAARLAKEVVTRRPGFIIGRTILAAALARTGQLAEARIALPEVRSKAQFEIILAFFRDPDERASVREALVLAGAEL